MPWVIIAGTTGKIAGQVISRSTNEPLLGANVFLEEIALGASTDEDGYFYILNVPPGEYRLTAQYIGFRMVTQLNVLVQVDRTTVINYSLESETLQSEENIVVEAERPLVQKDITSTVQNIGGQQINALPVNSVNQVLQLQAGVVNTGALHVRGGRSGEVAFFIDGHRIEDPLFNEEVIEINNQAIQQMEFLSGTFNAEYGNAMSGVVNIITRENFGKLRADVSYKRTNLSIESASNNLNERYWEGYLNGPLWPGSPVGFLLTGKKVDADNYYFSGISRTVPDSTGKLLYESVEFSKDKAFGFNDYGTILGKIYFHPFSTGKIALSYNYSDREWQSYVHDLRFIPDTSYIRTSASHLLGLNFTHAISKELFYDLKLSYYQYTFLRTLGGLDYTQYPIPLFIRFDNSLFYRKAADSAYEDQKTNSYTVKFDLTYQWNRFNLLKAGLDVKRYDLDYFFLNNPNNPLARYEVIYRLKPYEGAFYLQDKIEFDSIILNLGLRFDYYDPKTSYIQNPLDPGSEVESEMKTSFSQRIGIAYPVTQNMVFHFAYGQFFQRPPFEVMYENLNREFGTVEPLFGNPDLEPEKTASFELGLHTTLGASSSLQTTFFSKKIENLVGVAWNYQPLPYAYYLNEDFASVKGFEISAQLSRHYFFLGLNYTYSLAEGSSSYQQERYSGVYDVVGTQSLRFLPLDFDQRHTANAQLKISFGPDEAPFGFLPVVFQNSFANVLVRYGSGLPYTYNPERARYVADRNNSRMPSTITFDLLLQKDIVISPTRITFFLDIRNLLDRKNVRSVYSTTGSPDDSGSDLRRATPDYMQDPTNYYAPRTIYGGITLGL